MENNYFKNYPIPHKNFINREEVNEQPIQTPPVEEEDQDKIIQRLVEQSFIENILRLNTGKMANVYMTFTDSEEWRNKVFTGTIENAGRDHIILKDPKTGLNYMLLLIYLDYVTFEEDIEYDPRFARP